MEPDHRLCEQVGGGVPEHEERVLVAGVARGEDLDALAVRKRKPEVARRAVDPYEDGLLRQLRADGTRGVETRGALGQLELRRVGKDDLHRA
jgi:hypothetical protein